jgi:negative regulator of sigma-B (phosphoserine phosphatase)
VSSQVASFCQPARGESACGDLVVHREAGDEHLLAVIDVLGHGPKAADVAAQARQYLLGLPWPSAQTSEAIVAGLDEHLRGTRGAGAMVCLVRGDRLDGCGVGNVELRSVGAAVPTLMSPGVLGSQRPLKLRPFAAQVTRGTSLFLFSDGVSSRAPFSTLARLTPAGACESLARDHRKPHDDGSALVATFGSTLLWRRTSAASPSSSSGSSCSCRSRGT